jgi:glycosyltransferase involved in cell wall biosynthesis
VLEALSRGTPVVLLSGEDSAAVEFIEDGINGYVTAEDTDALAAAIARVRSGGSSLRDSAHAWFAGNAARLSLETSLRGVSAAYRSE